MKKIVLSLIATTTVLFSTLLYVGKIPSVYNDPPSNPCPPPDPDPFPLPDPPIDPWLPGGPGK